MGVSWIVRRSFMPFADTATGARLHYEDLNSQAGGIPVIAVHGLLGTARLQLGHVLDWLADEGYHVYGLTLRGYGESTPKPRDFPANFYHRDGDDVLAFMDALNIPKAHLLGYSDGGETVLVAAGKAPERIASVAAWGAVGSFGEELRPVFQRTYPGTWITEEDKALHGIPDTNTFAWQWVHSTTRMIDAGGDVSLSMAPGITAPVLLMLGKADTLNPQSYGQIFVDATPNGKLVMFDCGHPVHDQQTELFRQVVGEHLKSAVS
jgi:valacyclovir hydrolase